MPNTPDLSTLHGYAAKALKAAQRCGASAAEVELSQSHGLNIEVLEQDVERLEFTGHLAVQLTVYHGQQTATVSTSDCSDEALEMAAQKAYEIAQFVAPDPAAGLAPYTQSPVADLELYHPWLASPEELLNYALSCEKAAQQVNSALHSDGCQLSTVQGLRVYHNTEGFEGGYPSTTHQVSCGLWLLDEHGEKQSEGEWNVARRMKDLPQAQALGLAAAQKTLARQGSRSIETVQCPVLFDASCARSLLKLFLRAISGYAIYQKSSFLLNAMGESIFPAWASILEEPHLPHALGSAPFDDDGVPTRRQFWVQEGLLKQWSLSTYAARRLNLETTANAGGVHNARLLGPGHSWEALLKQCGTGLLVTSLMGQGVNLTTGDYSQGASGFWIEDGAIAYPVHEITIAGQLQSMFKELQAIGQDLDMRGRVHSSPWLISSMTVAGQSNRE